MSQKKRWIDYQKRKAFLLFHMVGIATSGKTRLLKVKIKKQNSSTFLKFELFLFT